MTTNVAGGGRVCGYQDCGERTGRPDHPLCYPHYLAFQNGEIGECPNCSGVYKPSGYRLCRNCGRQAPAGAGGRQQTQAPAGVGVRQQTQAPAGARVRQQPQDDSRGWGRPPESVPPQAVKAAELVRRNMTAHERACVNNEANTIQFLIMPMLRGLGWNDDDPAQVIREYKPAGKRTFRQSMAVDIALLDRGVPRVFVEAKRLDREYIPEYTEQLDKYASYLDDGGVAALTNGRHWLIHAVVKGETRHRLTIDVADGDAESVAGELNNAIGRDVVCGGVDQVDKAVADVSGQRRTRPAAAARRRDPGAIADRLKEYREREARRRGQPHYTILKDDTIGLIAEHQPTDLGRLGGIRGVGPSTLEQHGAAIIGIVRGA